MPRMLGCMFYVLLIVASTAGQAGTPHLTLDINTLRVARNSDTTYLGKLGNSIYFIAHDVPGGSNAALFKIDGPGGGATKVKDIGPGPGISANYGLYRPPYEKPTLFIAAGTKAYFLAWQDTTGQEVWVTSFGRGCLSRTQWTPRRAIARVGGDGSPLRLEYFRKDLADFPH